MRTTFPALLLGHATSRPRGAALREKEFGIWQTLDWGDLAALVRALACGLAEAGLTRGAHLVVVGENRPRLSAAMLAAQSLGAIPVPLYQDAVAAELLFPIVNAEVAFAIVEDQEQVDKMLELRGRRARSSRASGSTTHAGLRHYQAPGLSSIDALDRASGRAFAKPPVPASSPPRSPAASPTTSRRCSSRRAPPATRRASSTATRR